MPPGGSSFQMKNEVQSKGPSIKYVSISEGGVVSKMLTLADKGGGRVFWNDDVSM